MGEKRREDMSPREFLDHLWEQSQRPDVQEKPREMKPIATFRKAEWPDGPDFDGPDCD